MATPAYEDSQSLPTYADSPALPAPDTKRAPQSVWIQDNDTSGLYRKRYILPATAPTEASEPEPDTAAPPTYTPTPAPLYTVKCHAQHTSLTFHTPQLPDFSIYLGDGDGGPVVATGNIHSRTKKGLGEVRFFPRTSNNGESSSPTRAERPSVVLKEVGKKYTFTLDGQDLEWEETGPGEEAPAPAPPPPQAEPTSTGLLAKLKRKSVSKPTTALPTVSPRNTQTLVLTSNDTKTGVKTKIATYVELQPIGNTTYTYKAAPPRYKDGHTAKVDIHDPFFTFAGASSDAARELAVVTLVLLLEEKRRNVGRSANRTLFGGGIIGGAGVGCGGGGS